jgi:peptide/nickel transport system substrate-binding protein
MATRRDILKAGAGLAAALATGTATGTGGAWAQGQGKSLTISTSVPLASPNPYAHSNPMYYLWYQVYGSLGRFDYLTNEYKGILAKSWKNVNPTTWQFTLRDDLKRHDGGPGPKAHDVIHSFDRAKTDPASSQRFIFAEVASYRAVDDLTIEVVTKAPLAQFVSVMFGQPVAITSKELFDKHGADADKVAPHGWGPYALQAFDIDQRVVLKKSPHWPGLPADAPETVVYRLMMEQEQRVTALLNNEVQVARNIAPQLLDRLKNRSDVKILETSLLDWMFLAMNPNYKPWDDPRVRRAVAHAIDRDLIIKRLLFGFADKMDGAVLKDQRCYRPSPKAINYDPAKAKALLAEAGHPNGIDIEFYTANGRYPSDRQVAEAIAQMLRQVGFRVTLHAPEYVAFFSRVQKGELPMFYMGRGGQPDVAQAFSQFFQTGVTKRIGYSNPELDAKLQAIRTTFDEAKQCEILGEINDHLSQEVPAVFLWSHKAVHAIRPNVKWTPDIIGELWLPDVKA